MDWIFEVLAAIGGIGILIGVIWKFAGDLARDRLSESYRRQTEIELERLRQEYGAQRVRFDQFTESQVDIYIQLWEILQAMCLAVEALWYRVTPENLALLARQLRNTKRKIARWSLFFDQQDLVEIEQIIRALEQFEIGKQRLYEIKSVTDVDSYSSQEATEQIEQNRQYKTRFENLLERLRQSFRDKLAQIKYVYAP